MFINNHLPNAGKVIKNEAMKIVYNRFIPFKGFSAMMFFGIIMARKDCGSVSPITINHEKIHEVQAKETGGYILFYLRYLLLCVKHGYRNNPFEREAYDNAGNISYLESRPTFAWKKYIQK